MKITAQAIREQLSTMTIEDLRSLNAAIVNQINYRKSVDLHRAKSQLYPGARVKTNRPGRGSGKTFIVQKINPKNVICIEEGRPNTQWTITASLLELA
jgi:hypothetical protein